VISDHNHEYFEFEKGQDSPYMLLVANVRTDKRRDIDAEQAKLEGVAKVNAVRSVVPAITHVDYSARVQTVDRERNPRFRKLLESFYAKTGCPVTINTSFNIRGEPIVCTPQDAYRCFMATDMDILVLESFVLFKDEQPKVSKDDVKRYLESFDLD